MEAAGLTIQWLKCEQLRVACDVLSGTQCELLIWSPFEVFGLVRWPHAGVNMYHNDILWDFT